MLRNVGTLVTDNTASNQKDIMLHMSILRPPKRHNATHEHPQTPKKT